MGEVMLISDVECKLMDQNEVQLEEVKAHRVKMRKQVREFREIADQIQEIIDDEFLSDLLTFERSVKYASSCILKECYDEEVTETENANRVTEGDESDPDTEKIAEDTELKAAISTVPEPKDGLDD